MSFKAVIVAAEERLPADLFDKIASTGAETSIYKGDKTEEELISICKDADYVITYQGYFPFTPRVVENLPKCRFLQTLSIGYDEIPVEACTELGIGVINLQGFCVEELAEHAMALLLASARWIMTLHNRIKAGKTVPPASDEAVHHMSIIKGKTLGLIGFGESGRAMVPKANGFEMGRILAYDPYVADDVFREYGVTKSGLDDLLAESDYISLHAKLTDENRHLIGPEQFRKMKRGALLANIARGALIDEAALCNAIDEGRLGGAALDVTDPEPVPADSPLLKRENIIVTGHNAGTSPESKANSSVRPAEELARVMRGQWPLGLVNPEVREKYTARWGPLKEPEKG
jgi:D-3-phosphoglycerate dehydrogenase